MPTYEYRCSNCGNELEEIQSIKAEPLTHCPKCGKETLKRMISGGTSLIFKGSGFYLTDYKNKSVEPGNSVKKENTPAEATKSDTSGSTKSGETAPAKKAETKTESKAETKTDSSKSSTTTKKSS